MHNPNIVDSETWLTARLALLAKEKEFTRLKDELSESRRQLPSVEVVKPYNFANLSGNHTLSDLFKGKSQLIIYHFMYGADWESPCKSCSFWADNFNGIDIHLAHRDITFLVTSSAPIEMIEAVKKRMGWSFDWLSSGDSDFNQDFYVGFSPEQKECNEVNYNYKIQPYPADQMPGVSVLLKDDKNRILHTYSSYSRGLDLLNGAYNYMDLTPKGRDEADGIMKWLRLRDQY
ncbi:MAG: thioredoxin family protein [Granulosicoccaceae bacterium]